MKKSLFEVAMKKLSACNGDKEAFRSYNDRTKREPFIEPTEYCLHLMKEVFDFIESNKEVHYDDFSLPVFIDPSILIKTMSVRVIQHADQNVDADEIVFEFNDPVYDEIDVNGKKKLSIDPNEVEITFTNKPTKIYGESGENGDCCVSWKKEKDYDNTTDAFIRRSIGFLEFYTFSDNAEERKDELCCFSEVFHSFCGKYHNRDFDEKTDRNNRIEAMKAGSA